LQQRPQWLSQPQAGSQPQLGAASQVGAGAAQVGAAQVGAAHVGAAQPQPMSQQRLLQQRCLQQRCLQHFCRQPQPLSQPQLLSQPQAASQPQPPLNRLNANACEALQTIPMARTEARTRFIMGGAPQKPEYEGEDGNGNDIHLCRRNRRPRVALGNCGRPDWDHCDRSARHGAESRRCYRRRSLPILTAQQGRARFL
jgi:hypothetical protein